MKKGKADNKNHYQMDNRLYNEDTTVYAHYLYYKLKNIQIAYFLDVLTNIDFLSCIIKFVESNVTKNKDKIRLYLNELIDKNFIIVIEGNFDKSDSLFRLKFNDIDTFTIIYPEAHERLVSACQIEYNVEKKEIPPKEFMMMFKLICFIEKWREADYALPTVENFCKCLDVTEKKYYNLSNKMIEMGLISKEHGGWFEDSETPKRRPNRYKNMSC